MCGINGVFAYHYAANPIDPAELVRVRDHMAARGPDAEGCWISEERRIGLGHRRLAIIDLSDAGAQPMTSADGRFIVTFNGEIYNYRELRHSLQDKGRVFRSHSDTEVLLHLYALKGAAMVHDLRGMFAFAIWDSSERKLFLARDPYGIKPLYYSDDGWTFRFASQVKALCAGGALSNDPDPAGEIGFYLFGHVPEPFTTHRAISALPAGSTLVVDRIGARAPIRYHSIAQVFCEAEAHDAGGADGSADAEFRAAVLDSVRHHLIADVPVGVFLSSGMDSASLVGLMRDAGQEEIQAITLSFEEFKGTPDDEAPLAAEIARMYGARHAVRHVSEEEFERDLPAILEAMDLPTIDGVNTWFVSKAAREHGLKVAISGLGGDELLGGYPSFRDIPRWVRLMRIPSRVPLVGRLTRGAGQSISRGLGANPKAAGMLEYGGNYAGAYLLKRALFMPWELNDVLPRETLEIGLRRLSALKLIDRELTPRPSTPAALVSTLESTLYMRSRLLRDADWASMAHSLEVRTPLVDLVLLRRAAEIAVESGRTPTKAMLANAPSRPLSAAVMSRPKTGFMTPIATWKHRRTLEKRTRMLTDHMGSRPWARAWAEFVINARVKSCRAA